MNKTATISTHNGTAVHQAHNRREPKCVSKEVHIKPDGEFEIWKDESVRDAYTRIFSDAVDEYNKKQQRDDRKITDYYRKVKDSPKLNLAYEMIVGVYPKTKDGESTDISPEIQREILKEYVDDFKRRNPSLELIGAYYHADEEGEPHVHIDYVPVAVGYKNGMEKQASLAKALENQGFKGASPKLTGQILWERRENEYLDGLCRQRGIEVYHPKENREHLDTKLYKAVKALEELSVTQDGLESEIRRLDELKNKREDELKKLEEKRLKLIGEKRFSKDKALVDSLIKEAEKKLHGAEKSLSDAKQKSSEILKQAEERLSEAETARNTLYDIEVNKAEYLKDEVNKILEKNGMSSRKSERLKDFCKGIFFEDGENALEKFEKREIERLKRLNRDIDDFY